LATRDRHTKSSLHFIVNEQTKLKVKHTNIPRVLESSRKQLFLCFLSKECYFWGTITMSYLLHFNIVASFWTWQIDCLMCIKFCISSLSLLPNCKKVMCEIELPDDWIIIVFAAVTNICNSAVWWPYWYVLVDFCIDSVPIVIYRPSPSTQHDAASNFWQSGHHKVIILIKV